MDERPVTPLWPAGHLPLKGGAAYRGQKAAAPC